MDRIVVKDEIKKRLTDSVETALKIGSSSLVVAEENQKEDILVRNLNPHLLYWRWYNCLFPENQVNPV